MTERRNTIIPVATGLTAGAAAGLGIGLGAGLGPLAIPMLTAAGTLVGGMSGLSYITYREMERDYNQHIQERRAQLQQMIDDRQHAERQIERSRYVQFMHPEGTSLGEEVVGVASHQSSSIPEGYHPVVRENARQRAGHEHRGRIVRSTLHELPNVTVNPLHVRRNQ